MIQKKIKKIEFLINLRNSRYITRFNRITAKWQSKLDKYQKDSKYYEFDQYSDKINNKINKAINVLEMSGGSTIDDFFTKIHDKVYWQSTYPFMLKTIQNLVKKDTLELSEDEIKLLITIVRIKIIDQDILKLITNFYTGCIRIKQWLVQKFLDSGQSEKIQVICPGDASSKIVKFLQTDDFVQSNYQFISFSLSNTESYYDNWVPSTEIVNIDINNYIQNQIKDTLNIDNLIIMDHISMGNGSNVYAILDSIMKENLSNYDKLMLIYKEVLQVIRKVQTKTFNNIIPIENFFSGSILSYLTYADIFNSRCVPPNEEYESNLQYNDGEDFNCKLFVYFARIYMNMKDEVDKLWTIPIVYTKDNIILYFKNELETLLLDPDANYNSIWDEIYNKAISGSGWQVKTGFTMNNNDAKKRPVYMKIDNQPGSEIELIDIEALVSYKTKLQDLIDSNASK